MVLKNVVIHFALSLREAVNRLQVHGDEAIHMKQLWIATQPKIARNDKPIHDLRSTIHTLWGTSDPRLPPIFVQIPPQVA